MSTGVIVAIVVVAILLLLLFAVVLPRSRAKARERRLTQRRDEVAGAHRERAEQRSARAEMAEHQAARERAEAELHETRARLHERGLADDELDHERERLGSDDRADRATGERFSSERDGSVAPEERR
jgi:flagellar biosynthesis/type III secretory pathway M-ring protein FliF/YscJ